MFMSCDYWWRRTRGGVEKRVRFDLAGTCCHQKGGEKSLLHEKNILIPQRDKEDMRRIEFEFELLQIPSYVHRDLNLIFIPSCAPSAREFMHSSAFIRHPISKRKMKYHDFRPPTTGSSTIPLHDARQEHCIIQMDLLPLSMVTRLRYLLRVESSTSRHTRFATRW